jgi:pectate lyase
VYVDGVLVLDANDVDLSLGVPALLSYRVAAEYDNVVVSPADIATLWERTGERVCDFTCPLVEWESDDGEWSWQQDGSNEVFAQSSLTTAGRAPAGAITRNLDQVVETRARLRAFGAGTDPWFGVMTRYQDINNYAYLSLRRSNTLTLRKLVNGQIQELGAVAMTVTPGAWYRLRLDAVGNRLRAFVNGRQVLEVTDPQPTSGRVGVLTNRAQADFDDFIAVRP